MGFCFWDICHYVCNQIENGLKQAGCWFLVQELILVMNLVMGPYNGAAWFHTVKGSMEHYIAGATWECPLFRFFYEGMAEDAYDNSASVLGTEWHLKKMFQRIPEAKLFHNKGKRVKKSRWMSVWDALEIFLPYWTIFCLVLVWTCQKYGILKAISDLPQNDSFNAAAPNPEPECRPNDPMHQKSKEVRHSNAEIESMRKRARNTLHLVCMILCSRLKKRMAVILLLLVSPCRTYFKKMVTMCKTQSGGKMHWVSLAKGTDIIQEIHDILAVLGDPEMYRKAWFLPASRFSNSEDPEVQEDKELAKLMYTATVHLIGFRLLGCLNVMYSLPGKFAALLDAVPAEVQKALSELSEWWDRLEELEKAAQTDTAMMDILDTLEWPKIQWIRMILLGLYEADFKQLPPWIKAKLKSVFQGLCTTKPTEDLNRVIRNAEKNNNDNQDLGVMACHGSKQGVGGG